MGHVRPRVLRSVNDATGQRCVDLRALGNRAFDWQECRRDPEDYHGWRVVSAAQGFDTADAAWQAALNAVPWLAKETDDERDRT